MVPFHEANSDNVEKSFDILYNNETILMSTHNIKFQDKIRISLNIYFLELSEEFVGTQKRVQISHGKQAISVQAVEV